MRPVGIEISVVLHAFRIKFLNILQDSVIGGGGLIYVADTPGHNDGYVCAPRLVHTNTQLDLLVRLVVSQVGVISHCCPPNSCWRADQGGVGACGLVEFHTSFFLIPGDDLASDRAGPHEIEVGSQPHEHSQRGRDVGLQQNHEASLATRGKQRFGDREPFRRILQIDTLRTNSHGTDQLFSRKDDG